VSKLLAPLLFVLTLASGALAQTDAAIDVEIEARAKALETRLISPCCAHQTLDIHRSPEANRMKAEIRARLSKGETEEQLLADFERRYGPDIIAQSSVEQVVVLGVSLAGAGVLGAFGVAMALRRWRRRSDESDAEARQKSENTKREPKDDDELDERLRAELRAMDD
jgi:cytochrome c-type biogenesis protein CcmH/NrfF